MPVIAFALTLAAGSVIADPSTRPTTNDATRPATEPADAARPEWAKHRKHPLVVAARRAEVEAVRRLLDAGGVDPGVLSVALQASCRDASQARHVGGALGEPVEIVPVGLDAARDLTAITRQLLDAGADPNRTPSPRTTGAGAALQTAARYGTLEQVEALLKAGAIVDATPDRGTGTPLEAAILGSQRDVVARLLDAGASLFPPDHEGKPSPINLPGDDVEMLRLLLDRGANVDATTMRRGPDGREREISGAGAYALSAAARAGNADAIALLVDRGVRTPEALVDAARELVEQDARRPRDGEERVTEGRVEATRRRQIVLDLLLDAGLDPSGPEGSGLVLYYAIVIDDAATVKSLKARGGRIDPHRLLEGTYRGSWNEEAERVRLGALPEHERFGVLFDNAVLRGDPKGARALAAEGIPVPIGVAAMIDDVARVRELLAIDPTLANRYPSGNGFFGPLRMAASQGHLEVCQLLLDAGAEIGPAGVGSRGWGGMTPLEAAAAGGHVEVVRLLLARGARVDVRNLMDNDTPLATHLENYVRKQSREAESRRLLGVIEVLPLLRAAATRPTTSPTSRPS